MTDGSRGTDAERCPECRVPLKDGLKYCEFCGRKVDVDVVVAAFAKKPVAGAAGGMLKGLAVVCLSIGALVYLGSRLGGKEIPQAPRSLDGKRQVAAVCEAGIRDQARGPFRVIAFRSALVAEERGGYVVSGTVELQSAAGELQRKRYFCRLHPDARAGIVLDEGKMY